MLDKTHPLEDAVWKVAEAKNRFSEVLNRADHEPQVIRRRGQAYVVLPQEKYDELAGNKMNFIEFLLSAPSMEGLDLERDRSPMREVDFGDID